MRGSRGAGRGRRARLGERARARVRREGESVVGDTCRWVNVQIGISEVAEHSFMEGKGHLFYRYLQPYGVHQCLCMMFMSMCDIHVYVYVCCMWK